MSKVPSIILNNGVEMPQLGFGVFQVPDDETARPSATRWTPATAASTPPRSTATRRASGRRIAESGVARDELFVTTKLWNADQGYDATLARLRRQPDELGLDYVDLYLIHWPPPAKDLYVDTWQAFEKLHADGRARAIGVSNFQPDHLRAADRTRRASSRRSTRSSCTRASSSTSCAPSTPSTASSPSPGARWPGRACWRTRRSPPSPRRTATRRPRSSCAGTSSSATW